MIGVTKIGRRNANYWIQAVAEGGDDYYTKPGEKPGEWMGQLAAELGLEGEVDRDAYAALLAGKNPITGDILVRRPEPRVFVDAAGKTRRKEPILGYDIRFSAPKSVSLLWAVGSPQVQAVVERALDEAIRESLGHLEQHACFVQRGKGGTVIERGAGFLSMKFLHRSSRAGDPALHAHLVTANMTRAVSDGRWLSLANPKQQSPLLREAKSTGYVFQAVLRSELTRELGVEWNEVVNGYADILGVPRAAIDHFSRRRGEIVEEMAQRGATSPAAAEVAAYRTRDAKDYSVDPDSQRQDWRSQAAEFDLTERSIDRLLARTKSRQPRPIGARELADALAALESTHSHFDRRDLLCAVADQMRAGAGAGELQRAVDGLLAGDRVVQIHRGEGLLETSYYTTPRLWQLEQRVIKAAREGQRAGVGVVDEAMVGAVLARHRYLSAEQLQMVRRLTTGGERIVTVAALPGAGKTTALRAAREAWFEADIRGVGIATARSASGELQDAGIVPATSITDLLIRGERRASEGRQPLPSGTVIVMDESSTTSTPQMAAVVDLVEACEGKLVCIGDPRQIGAVGPGGLYGHLTDVIEPSVLTEIRRQRDPLDRHVVELAHGGRGSDALDLLRSRDRLVIADTLDQTLDAQVLDWYRDFAEGNDAVMIARRIRDVADLNARAREILVSEGRLGKESVRVGGYDFAVGDCVVTRVNSPAVSNRERWEVIGVDASESHLKMRRIGGDERTIVAGPGYLERRTDNGEPAIQHAYALTTYATESKTFDSAYALLDGGISREDFVVAVSRATGPTTAYGVAASELLDADLGPATRDIADPAHDIRVGAERVAAEFAASEVADRKRIDRLGAAELAPRREQLRKNAVPRDRPNAAEEQLHQLDTRIAETIDRLSDLDAERAKLAASDAIDRHRLSLIESNERLSRRQLQRLEGDRQPMAAAARAESRQPSGLSGAERTELALIEDKLLRIRRREVAEQRMRPSKLVVDAIGTRPEDPTKAAVWNEGVDLILEYRQCHRVTSADGHPLGPKPREASRRSERRAAELRLQRIQHALGHQQDRATARTAGITR
jgi:conjugative relaxase-like TrwC/TraI family protein